MKFKMIKLFEQFLDSLGNEESYASVPKIVLDNIKKIKVNYINFEGELKTGIIECNIKVAEDLELIFKELLDIKFPIKEINPISLYDNDDMKSVIANNCSCFNYRLIAGSNDLSDHSTGNAIDINPMQNPWIHPSAHKIEGRQYKPGERGTITEEVVDIFKSYGWKWGGDWNNPDYQHFFKPDVELKKEIMKFYGM